MKYKKISKKVIKDIAKLQEKLNCGKYYYLSKLLKTKNLEDFLFDFMKLYDVMPNIKYYDYQYFNGKCYKFIYFDEIRKKTCKTKDNISKKINILALLGLIKKLNIYDENIVSSSIIKRTIDKSRKEQKRCVNYYNIPNYTNKVLKEADNIESKILENKMTIKNFNKSFVISVFGQEIADKIFLDKRKIPKEYELLMNNIRKNIISYIELNNIAKVNDLIEFICNSNKTYSKNIIKNNVNIIINEMIFDKLIIRRKLSKQEKVLYKAQKDDRYNYILKGDKWNGK